MLTTVRFGVSTLAIVSLIWSMTGPEGRPALRGVERTPQTALQGDFIPTPQGTRRCSAASSAFRLMDLINTASTIDGPQEPYFDTGRPSLKALEYIA